THCAGCGAISSSAPSLSSRSGSSFASPGCKGSAAKKLRGRRVAHQSRWPVSAPPGLASWPNRQRVSFYCLTEAAPSPNTRTRIAPASSPWLQRSSQGSPSYAKRSIRRLDLIGPLVLRTCNEAEGAACCVNDHLAGGLIGVVHKFVESNDRRGSHAQIGIVDKSQIRDPGASCANRFVRVNVATSRKRARDAALRTWLHR